MLTRSRQNGVTIIEVVIGIAIIGLLLVMGLPSYTTWLMNTQIRNAAESVLNGLQLARNEAVRRNASVEFALGTASGWTITTPGVPDPIQTRTASEGSNRVTVTTTGGTKVTFNSIGRVTANADGSGALTQVNFDVAGSETTSRDLHIVISTTGNVRMCDPNVSATTDPRKCP